MDIPVETEETADRQIRQSSLLARTVAVVSVVLLAAFFAVAVKNAAVVQEQMEALQDDPYPVSVAAGRVETLLVQLKTIAASAALAQTPEAVERMEEAYLRADADLTEKMAIIAASGFVDAGEARALQEGCATLFDRQRTLVSMCADSGREPEEIQNYVKDEIEPLLAELLDLDAAVIGDSTAAVRDICDTIDVASRQTLSLSWALVAAVTASLAVLLALLSRKKRREERLRATLRQALDEAREASEAKSAFLSSMSHDMRTPLNAIIGFASIARANQDDPERVAASLERIDTSSKHLLHLVDDVLDMSQIEEGRISLNEEEFRPRRLAKDVLAIVSPQAEGKGLRLELDADGIENEVFVGDPARLSQMLLNLTANAVKYTDEGSVRVVLRERPCDLPCHSELVMSVRDTGVGMAPEFLERAFEPFEREEGASARAEGAGIGLSTVRSLADAMGATVSVESRKGEGSEFAVAVPLRVSDGGAGAAQGDGGTTAAEPRSRTTAEDVGGGRAGETAPSDAARTSRRVLLVEDDPLNREVALGLIEPLGVEVDAAENGLEAVETATGGDRDRYGLVLMDCQMPVMDGIEAVRRIRSWEAATGATRIPIVALTADVLGENRERALAVGMDGFITKPISVPELARCIDDHLPRP